MSEIDTYLSDAPEPQRATLTQLRAVLAGMLPDAEEGLSYGVPAFKVGGRPVAGFAYAKKHCSYFPHSGAILDQVEDALLAGHEWSKGTLRFPIDEIPSEELLRRLIDLRLAQINS